VKSDIFGKGNRQSSTLNCKYISLLLVVLQMEDMTDRTDFIYIMTNDINQMVYIGVTNDIYRRTIQRKTSKGGKFTSRYHLTKLVYYEVYDFIEDAILREKQIKGGSRQNKIDLVNGMISDWEDLSENIEM
jgi:putative endonuclease